MRGAILFVSLAGLCLAADLADGWRGTDPYELVAAPDEGPSALHPLGTDGLGRDRLSRFLHGGRVSLFVASLAAVLSTGFGALIGLSAGFAGGWWEAAAMRGTELFMALPKLPALLFAAAVAAGAAGVWAEATRVGLLIAALSWMDVARLSRASARRLRRARFVEAARAHGLGRWAILRRHLLPHLVGPLGIAFALELSEAVLLESSLSFLGLGLQPPTPSWGRLMADGAEHIAAAPLWLWVLGAATWAVVFSAQRSAEGWRRAWALPAGLDRGDGETAYFQSGDHRA